MARVCAVGGRTDAHRYMARRIQTFKNTHIHIYVYYIHIQTQRTGVLDKKKKERNRYIYVESKSTRCQRYQVAAVVCHLVSRHLSCLTSVRRYCGTYLNGTVQPFRLIYLSTYNTDEIYRTRVYVQNSLSTYIHNIQIIIIF